ncbi:MAG: transposase [Candidatus Thiodiazotropha sp.]|jgi:transposase
MKLQKNSNSDQDLGGIQAIHVLDRFSIMAHFGNALDEVRAGEAGELKAKGYEPVLTKSRWLLVKRPENLTDKQGVKLAERLQYNLRPVKAYLLKEEFQSKANTSIQNS